MLVDLRQLPKVIKCPTIRVIFSWFYSSRKKTVEVDTVSSKERYSNSKGKMGDDKQQKRGIGDT